MCTHTINLLGTVLVGILLGTALGIVICAF